MSLSDVGGAKISCPNAIVPFGASATFSIYLDANAGAVASCNPLSPVSSPVYNVIDIKITTGNDDARSDSEVDATLTLSNGAQQNFILKPQNGPDPCDRGQNAWNNWETCDQSFDLSSALSVPNAGQFKSITITLGEHSGGLEGPDNWDIQAISVTVSGKGGSPAPLNLLTLGNPPDPSNPNNCYTRLKNNPQNWVLYTFGGNNPSNGCPQ